MGVDAGGLQVTATWQPLAATCRPRARPGSIPREMPETPAQRSARERNLAKGNPNAYRGGAQGEKPAAPRAAQGAAQGDPPAAQGAAPGAQGAPGKTFRAKSAPAPRKRRVPPRAPQEPAQGAPAAAPRAPKGDTGSGGGGGFLGGLLEGLFG